MNSIKSLIRILSTSLGLGVFTFLVCNNQQVQAQSACTENPTTFSSACRGTPDRYEITVYEMGLCTSNPLSSTNFDNTTCSSTLTSSSGVSADLAGSATQDLSSGVSTRPPNDTYGYAYIIISNDFGLKGNYTVNDVPYYSTSSGGADTSSPSENWTETLNDFSSDSSCTTTFNETVSTGVISARLTDSSLTTTSDGTCGSERLVGSFAFTTPIVISEETKGLEVKFTVTNSGMTVIPNSGSDVGSFSGGPFKPTFVKF